MGGITAEPLSIYKVKDLIHDTQEKDKEILGIKEETRFRLTEETDNILTSIEQRNAEAYNSVMNVELPKAETPIEIAKNKQAERTLLRFDKDFASMEALSDAVKQTELYKYIQKGRLSEAYKGLFDSMVELHNLIQEIEKQKSKKMFYLYIFISLFVVTLQNN